MSKAWNTPYFVECANSSSHASRGCSWSYTELHLRTSRRTRKTSFKRCEARAMRSTTWKTRESLIPLSLSRGKKAMYSGSNDVTLSYPTPSQRFSAMARLNTVAHHCPRNSKICCEFTKIELAVRVGFEPTEPVKVRSEEHT